MKKRILSSAIAVLVCLVLSCPSSRRSVTLRIQNDSSQYSVTSITVIKISGIGFTYEHITENLISEAIEPGDETSIVISMEQIADGDGFGLAMDGWTSPLVGLDPVEPMEAGAAFVAMILNDSILIQSE
ncbi:MAG TPA: hypothetical protein PLJ47_08350 [Candidatus Hydrogenedentes bacterium]|nr:hypothetical protein [Candidatus Hydrogenedentota bacterium]HRK34591.1 hypothetical protein [Candidatus Hydrogenedentota bacterium]